MSFSRRNVEASSEFPPAVIPTSGTATQNSLPASNDNISNPSARLRRQLTLTFGGASFFLLSTLVTRRAILRRQRTSVPAFYNPSNQPPRVNSALLALEAFNLATLNAVSGAMFLTGGIMWAFDIGSLEDLRERARRKVTAETNATQPTPEDLQKLEEWLNTVLSRKDYKEVSDKVKKELEDAKNASDR